MILCNSYLIMTSEKFPKMFLRKVFSQFFIAKNQITSFLKSYLQHSNCNVFGSSSFFNEVESWRNVTLSCQKFQLCVKKVFFVNRSDQYKLG